MEEKIVNNMKDMGGFCHLFVIGITKQERWGMKRNKEGI